MKFDQYVSEHARVKLGKTKIWYVVSYLQVLKHTVYSLGENTPQRVPRVCSNIKSYAYAFDLTPTRGESSANRVAKSDDSSPSL